MNRVLFVGVDAAGDKHQVVAMDESRQVLWEGEIPNNHEGCDTLIEILSEWKDAEFEIWIAGEGHGGYLSPLDLRLCAAGFRFVGIHPTQVTRFREMCHVSQDKDDRRDALLLAEMLLWRSYRGELLVNGNTDEYFRSLRDTARTFGSLQKEKVALQNRMVSKVREFWPELVKKDHYFSRTDSVGILTLLAHYPTPAQIGHAGVAKVAKLLTRATRRDASRLAKRLVEDARAIEKALVLPAYLEELVKRPAECVLNLCKCLRDLEKSMETLLMEHPFGQWLLDQPGIGSRTAGPFLGEAGNLGRFVTDSKLSRFSGTGPVRAQSGKMRGHHYDGHRYNHRLKRVLLLMARSRSLSHLPSKKFLEKRIEGGDSYWKAIKALARHVIRFLWNSWQKVVNNVEEKSETPTPLFAKTD